MSGKELCSPDALDAARFPAADPSAWASLLTRTRTALRTGSTTVSEALSRAGSLPQEEEETTTPSAQRTSADTEEYKRSKASAVL